MYSKHLPLIHKCVYLHQGAVSDTKGIQILFGSVASKMPTCFTCLHYTPPTIATKILKFSWIPSSRCGIILHTIQQQTFETLNLSARDASFKCVSSVSKEKTMLLLEMRAGKILRQIKSDGFKNNQMHTSIIQWIHIGLCTFPPWAEALQNRINSTKCYRGKSWAVQQTDSEFREPAVFHSRSPECHC